MARKKLNRAVRQAAERAASAAEEEAEQSAAEAGNGGTAQTDNGVVEVPAPGAPLPGNSVVIVTEPHPAV
jgi:hypothetical protein